MPFYKASVLSEGFGPFDTRKEALQAGWKFKKKLYKANKSPVKVNKYYTVLERLELENE